MQSNLFPPTSPQEAVQQHFGFKLDKRVREFEVIAEAVSRGLRAKGSLGKVYEMAITFLNEVIENEKEEKAGSSEGEEATSS